MAVNDDIVLSKGNYSVTLFTFSSSENYKNNLTILPMPTAPAKQDDGPKDTKVVDLLRLTHTFSFECYITPTESKTAKAIKDDLLKIAKGADIQSTPASLTYEDTSFDVFVEDVVIRKINNDNVVGSGYSGYDNAEYRVTLSLVEGKTING